MKKSYMKPKVCCKNYQTGQMFTNDPVYAEQAEKKMTAFREKEGILALEEDGEAK